MSTSNQQSGFTIMELLIATMVFSVILLLVTFGIIQIGNRYYKATLQAETQTATRNAMDEFSRNIQFSNGDLSTPSNNGTGGIYAFCINNTQYAYMPHTIQDATGTYKHVFYAQTAPSGCTLPAVATFQNSFPSGARDLLANRMRIVNFSVTHPNQASPFQITLRVASGQDDLLCSPSANSGSGDCNDTTDSHSLGNPDLICKLRNGSTYCAISELSTAVTQRLAS